MTIDKLHTLACPKMACKKTMRSRLGTLRNSSVSRMSRVSSHWGARPLTVP